MHRSSLIALSIIATAGCGAPQPIIQGTDGSAASPAVVQPDDVENTVRAVLAEQFRVSPKDIPLDLPISDPPLNADDLDLVEIVMELEDRFDITLSDAALARYEIKVGNIRISPKQLQSLVDEARQPNASKPNKSDWMPNEDIQRMLVAAAAGMPADLRSFVAESPLRAVDASFTCLLLVREHDAWRDDGGWRDANTPVVPNGQGLQMINYYQVDYWSKLPVPQKFRIRSVAWDGTHFVFDTARGKIRSTPRQVKDAVTDSITGRALSDERIEHDFGKLDGSVPLDGPP